MIFQEYCIACVTWHLCHKNKFNVKENNKKISTKINGSISNADLENSVLKHNQIIKNKSWKCFIVEYSTSVCVNIHMSTNKHLIGGAIIFLIKNFIIQHIFYAKTKKRTKRTEWHVFKKNTIFTPFTKFNLPTTNDRHWKQQITWACFNQCKLHAM